jgi:hypothetical protein
VTSISLSKLIGSGVPRKRRIAGGILAQIAQPHLPTVAEKMLSDLEKINKSLEELRVKGLPMSFIVMYVNKKSRVPIKDIENVFLALKDLNKEIQPLR